ncbi:dihydroxyacetone kinase family protein [Rhodopila sp.]|uniref:dihydroxyacetone kinase family protein n=1 Tax=Rhodopila sp. TaxID=2480087 RepID=UPI003D109120
MKKLVNDPRHVVREMLEGLADITPGIALLDREDVVIREDLPEPAQRPVAVISGGGAGHEPAHAGYVGVGMLHAAVVGDVFTSPSVDAVLAAVQAVAGPAGVVLIVKNYTGDRLNFGLAAELARSAGIPAEIVVVADDVALRGTVEPGRRRGIAGTVLIHKIAGALAEAGASLPEVAEAARQAASAIGSMGVALGACTVPAAGTAGFSLADDEIELGLGIHGEPGVQRTKLQPADPLVDLMLDAILEDRSIRSGDGVALLVNGLGGTPPMELAVVTRRALTTLRARGITVERVWSGTLLSALEMPGCSLSLLPVDPARLAHLDAATTAPAWPGSGVVPRARVIRPASVPIVTQDRRNRSHDEAGAAVLAGALAGASALEARKRQLTDLDSAAGDGDLGISMARGAAAIQALSGNGAADAASALTRVAETLRRSIAGSSGPFYAVGLLRAAQHLAASETLDASTWATAFERAVDAVAELGGARPGDRTMLDALYPAVAAFKAALGRQADVAAAWADCVQAAEAGAAATARMRPRLGRASYLGDRVLGVQDAGAVAVTIWLRALLTVVE